MSPSRAKRRTIRWAGEHVPFALRETNFDWVLQLSALHKVETNKLDCVELLSLCTASYRYGAYNSQSVLVNGKAARYLTRSL